MAVAHVASWRNGCAAPLPDDLLACLSVEQHTTAWTSQLAEGSGGRTFIALSDDDTVLGFATMGRRRDEDAAPQTGELVGDA